MRDRKRREKGARGAPHNDNFVDPTLESEATDESEVMETTVAADQGIEAVADEVNDTISDAADAGTPEEAISDELREELRELEELRDRHLRLAAEFDNFRRRTRRELLESRETAQADLTTRLLDALDDLTRVADTPADSTTTQALHEGVELVERKLLKALTDAGMEAINPIGERFDPNVHEGLFTEETDDPEQDERVARVVSIGYRFGGRLLRPAGVGVFQHDSEAEST
jgi:molecular chaperone GrpE